MKARDRSRGFVLFEAMLAVTIFALAVLALARCVDGCLRAEMLKEEDARARQLLENRMAEVEMGAVNITETTTEEMKGMFAGMKLTQSRKPLKRKNEKGQEINGLFIVTLEAKWKSRGEESTSALQFYVYPRQGQ